ncbi:MAG TPA: NAD(+)/NADH kinase [Clostridia bacterium]|nr:NAD(+)/NADH kinase [Clostridia bacterium]
MKPIIRCSKLQQEKAVNNDQKRGKTVPMKISIIANPEKAEAADVTKYIEQWARENNIQLVPSPQLETLLNRAWAGDSRAEPGVDCIFVLGGDGTLLSVARRVAPVGIPILGINLGNLGFLTSIELSGLKDGLDSLIRQGIHVEERMMLEAEVVRADAPPELFYALNDMVITKGAFARMIRLTVSFSGQYVDTFPADGVIVSSPTGSTAYCLSAGGPIVSPDLEAMIVIPICPHNLYSRPMVISPTEEVSISIVTQGVEAMLTVDGQYGVHLKSRDKVTVRKAPFYTRLVRTKDRTFFSVLREKLQEGTSSD